MKLGGRFVGALHGGNKSGYGIDKDIEMDRDRDRHRDRDRDKDRNTVHMYEILK